MFCPLARELDVFLPSLCASAVLFIAMLAVFALRHAIRSPLRRDCPDRGSEKLGICRSTARLAYDLLRNVIMPFVISYGDIATLTLSPNNTLM